MKDIVFSEIKKNTNGIEIVDDVKYNGETISVSDFFVKVIKTLTNLSKVARKQGLPALHNECDTYRGRNDFLCGILKDVADGQNTQRIEDCALSRYFANYSTPVTNLSRLMAMSSMLLTMEGYNTKIVEEQLFAMLPDWLAEEVSEKLLDAREENQENHCR